MRLFISSLPLFALAALIANYTYIHGWRDEVRMEAAPEAIVYYRKFELAKKLQLRENSQPPQVEMLSEIFRD